MTQITLLRVVFKLCFIVSWLTLVYYLGPVELIELEQAGRQRRFANSYYISVVEAGRVFVPGSCLFAKQIRWLVLSLVLTPGHLIQACVYRLVLSARLVWPLVSKCKFNINSAKEVLGSFLDFVTDNVDKPSRAGRKIDLPQIAYLSRD